MRMISIAGLTIALTIAALSGDTADAAADDSGENALVIQADFPGLVMTGVAHSVSKDLDIYNIRPLIPLYDIRSASASLDYNAQTWPAGTVFVSVVDPGVGTERKSVVLKTKSGHYFVSPDNGSLTLVAETLGIAEVRRIDESVNRLEGSARSHTFHGRDVYSYTGARLAAGVISYEQVGPVLDSSVVSIEYKKPALTDGRIVGNVPILDTHYGNVWTNIDAELFDQLGIAVGDFAWVKISDGAEILFEEKVRFVSSFGGVELGDRALYVNDILKIGLAVNQGNFAEQYGVEAGPDRNIEIWK